MELAHTLKDAHNLSDPVRPLPSGDPRYVDCASVRGDEDVVSLLFNAITWSDRHVAQLLTGHRGCGKSTELLRLQSRLAGAGYVVLYFEADDDLNLDDLEYTDLLLCIARRVAGDLSAHHVHLSQDLLKSVADWFSETLYTEEQRRDLERELSSEAALGIGLPESMPGEQLRALRCHVVYTVPISVIYSDKATTVTAIFPDYQVLPMLKVKNRDGSDYTPGLEAVRRILASRIDLEVLFTSEAVDYLCRACGGHPRDLMILVRYACQYALGSVWPQPIALPAVRRAEARLVAEYGRMIPEDHFPLLARVFISKAIQNDDAHELMLYNLSVLEYINGAPPWHDVHPAVTHLPRFQEALSNERTRSGLAVG